MTVRINLRAAVLCLLALVGLAAAAPAPAAEYLDVPKWHWAWNYIQGVTDAEVSAGFDDGLYRPGTVVSRAQMAVFIARAMCGGDSYVPRRARGRHLR
ncbi:MAG TPA: S-layer homology domain-containing protein [Armatimonadota bacterium]|nr:S-layer homology domain-containing protein [Armatimonadota bacterium]